MLQIWNVMSKFFVYVKKEVKFDVGVYFYLYFEDCWDYFLCYFRVGLWYGCSFFFLLLQGCFEIFGRWKFQIIIFLWFLGVVWLFLF